MANKLYIAKELKWLTTSSVINLKPKNHFVLVLTRLVQMISVMNQLCFHWSPLFLSVNN